MLQLEILVIIGTILWFFYWLIKERMRDIKVDKIMTQCDHASSTFRALDRDYKKATKVYKKRK